MSPVLEWLPAAVAVVVFLGAALVYLRGSKDKGTIETLSRNNAALNERVQVLENEAVTHKAEDAKNVARIAALEQEKSVLESVANSSEKIAQLRTEVTELIGKIHDAIAGHHEAAMTGVGQLHADLSTTNATLKSMERFLARGTRGIE